MERLRLSGTYGGKSIKMDYALRGAFEIEFYKAGESLVLYRRKYLTRLRASVLKCAIHRAYL